MAQRLSQAWAGMLGEHRPDTEYYDDQTGIGMSTPLNIVADYICAVPIMLGKQRTADRIAVHIGGAGGANSAYLGIYEDDGDLLPDSLVLDAGTISIAVTGVIAATISEVLPPGLYWLVILPEANCTIYAHYYSRPILGFDASSFATFYRWWRVAQAYGALPASFPGSPVKQTGTPPIIGLRFSA